MTLRHFKSGLFLLMIALIWSSCKKDEPKPADVKVSIKTYVKNEEAEQNIIQYPMAVGHTYSLTKLVYYLTHISLVKEDGTVIELKKAHQKDISKENTGVFEATDVEAGTYKAMTFTFGISKSDNEVNFLENTLPNQNMFWPSQLGPGAYHYMKFEGQYKVNGSGEQKGFAFHLGPTSGADYSTYVSEAIDMTIDGAQKNMTIKMDLDRWFHSPHNYDFEDWEGMGIMDKPAAQAIAHQNSQDVFSVTVD